MRGEYILRSVSPTITLEPPPHARGIYPGDIMKVGGVKGPPPHAREIQLPTIIEMNTIRNTPACAENTFLSYRDTSQIHYLVSTASKYRSSFPLCAN